MKCYRCRNDITDLKMAMIFWKEVEGEGGQRVYEEFEICHKPCKPRERWEMCWELGWFTTDRQVLEWLSTVIPRAVSTVSGGGSRVHESLVRVIIDLSKYVIKGEPSKEVMFER